MNNKQIKCFHIDTFTDEIFKGNPAAICPLDEWIPDDLMQNIAAENNLPETGFFVKEENGYHIRWFTPTVEVDLCGHATLAAAYVLHNYLDDQHDTVSFQSNSGELSVRKSGDYYVLDFPSDTIKEVDLTDKLTNPFDVQPIKALKGKTDYMLIFEDEEVISKLTPDFSQVATIDARGVIVTAKGDETDFVSRFFGPQSGVNEDPVTGSAHTTLTPYWSDVLNKTDLTAKQLSDRGGFLKCSSLGERVQISGQAITYSTGTIVL